MVVFHEDFAQAQAAVRARLSGSAGGELYLVAWHYGGCTIETFKPLLPDDQVRVFRCAGDGEIELIVWHCWEPIVWN